MDEFIPFDFGKDHGSEKFCPCLNDPHPDCYCSNMNSQKILYALQFCQRNYKMCDIYQRLVKQQAD